MINGVKINRPKTKVARADRVHHRSTIITTDKQTFAKVRSLKEGETLQVVCPNDIISSARGGLDNVHHSIRRVTLLRRQVAGGFRRVRVRWEQGNEIGCTIHGVIVGENDAPTCKVTIQR